MTKKSPNHAKRVGGIFSINFLVILAVEALTHHIIELHP